MTQLKVLWPTMRWPGDRQIEIDSLGSGIAAEFVDQVERVTPEQWASADGVVSAPDLPVAARDQLVRCRIFVTPKVGFDNLDLEAWGALGIPVCNVPDYGTMEVADHTMALLLSLMKGITFHTRELKKGPRTNWRPALNPFGRRLSRCTLGIVGLGRIGTATALRAKAFGMDVVFCDPFLPSGAELAIGVRRNDDLGALIAESDVLSLHVPMSEANRNLIDAEVLARAKPGLILINTARGELIDLDALHDALRSERLAAVGLDVLPEEPANEDHPLIRAWAAGEEWIDHRLLITPHSAFFTPESMYDMRFKAGAVAAAYLRDGRLLNCVNEPFLTHRR